MKPSKHKMTVLSQIFKLIPRNLIPKLANEFGIDRQSRVFSPTSHVLALVFGQLTHALGLNDICDTLRNHCGLVSKSQTSLATTRTRCAGKYGRLFSHIFYSALLHGRMNGSILLQDCSLPCAESSGAAWIWEVSSDVVGQHLTLSVCEALRNRHIYQDSHNYNPTQRKGKTGNG